MKVTNKNCSQEEIKGRLNSGNASYHSAQNLLSSCLLPKNVKIRIYRTIILPVVLYGSLVLSEEHTLEGVGKVGVEENIWTEQ
jgi:ribosomal protein L37E